MNTILQFNFEIGDKDCKYYQVYVVAKCHGDIYSHIEDAISEFYEVNGITGESDDMEYEDIVDRIMKNARVDWNYIGATVPESHCILSFWID